MFHCVSVAKGRIHRFVSHDCCHGVFFSFVCKRQCASRRTGDEQDMKNSLQQRPRLESFLCSAVLVSLRRQQALVPLQKIWVTADCRSCSRAQPAFSTKRSCLKSSTSVHTMCLSPTVPVFKEGSCIDKFRHEYGKHSLCSLQTHQEKLSKTFNRNMKGVFFQYHGARSLRMEIFLVLRELAHHVRHICNLPSCNPPCLLAYGTKPSWLDTNILQKKSLPCEQLVSIAISYA